MSTLPVTTGVKERAQEKNWRELRNRVKELEAQNVQLRANASDSQQAFEHGMNFAKFSFAARELRSRRSDFESVMKRYRELRHVAIIQELAEKEPDGAEAIYAMAKRGRLLAELDQLDAVAAAIRFRHFLADWREGQ